MVVTISTQCTGFSDTATIVKQQFMIQWIRVDADHWYTSGGIIIDVISECVFYDNRLCAANKDNRLFIRASTISGGGSLTAKTTSIKLEDTICNTGFGLMYFYRIKRRKGPLNRSHTTTIWDNGIIDRNSALGWCINPPPGSGSRLINTTSYWRSVIGGIERTTGTIPIIKNRRNHDLVTITTFSDNLSPHFRMDVSPIKFQNHSRINRQSSIKPRTQLTSGWLIKSTIKRGTIIDKSSICLVDCGNQLKTAAVGTIKSASYKIATSCQ